MISIESQAGQYPLEELERFLQPIVTEPVRIGAAGGADRRVSMLVNPQQAHEVMIDHTASATRIAGRTYASMLHGVYCFLERLGYVFTARGPIAPEGKVAWPGAFTMAHTPALAQRGIRQHINFPMDISCLNLEDACEYVRNLGRLKLNVLYFHLYAGLGWLRFDREGCSGGTDTRSTLYYGECHDVARDPVVRAQSASCKTWFIPELESHYQQPSQHELLRNWLGGVMQCARTCGMMVGASIETLHPAHDKRLEAMGAAAGMERYARGTAITAMAALEAYPQIDQIEIISGENGDNWPAPPSPAQAVRELADELGIPAAELGALAAPSEADNLPAQAAIDAANNPQAQSAKLVVAAVRSLQVAAKAIELMHQDPRAAELLGERTIARGIYMTDARAWEYLGPLVPHLVPKGVPFSVMAAHSSRRTARSLEAAALPADLLSRTRIYAWCEFDGLMYLLQNESEGLHQCIQEARRDGGTQPAAVLGNHWRIAENELSIGYLGAGGFTGCSPVEFYQDFLSRIMGPKAAVELSQAMVQLDDATAFGVEKLFNLGFCYLGCWNLARLPWSPKHIQTYHDMLASVEQRIESAMPAVTREVGQERCRLMVNRLQASQIHCRAIIEMRAMRDLLDQASNKLPADRQAAFVAHARKARELAASYVSLSAAMLPDRTSEGNLVSYEHLMYGLLDKSLKEYVGEQAAADAGPDLDAPPAPLSV